MKGRASQEDVRGVSIPGRENSQCEDDRVFNLFKDQSGVSGAGVERRGRW